MKSLLTPENSLPEDGCAGTLVGRVQLPEGPAVVAIRGDGVYDVTAEAPTMSTLLDAADPVAVVRTGLATANRIGDLADILANSAHDANDPSKPWFLCPVDLQAVKASGVTFVASLLERVIEEQARGDAGKAEAVRQTMIDAIGTDLSEIKPGSESAARLKDLLIEKGVWSQYLEVGIGPDAEIFTKGQPMSSLGTGAEIGILAGIDLEQPGAGNRAGRLVRGQDRRRHAGQRRQPARHGRPQRPAARQGQGQQRVLLDRPVHPPVRRDLRHRGRARRPSWR